MGDFRERLEALRELVGEGTVQATVTNDQIYSLYQHERADLKHPHGGKAFYLRDPLLAGQDRYFQGVADRLLEEGPVEPMIDAAKDLIDASAIETPKDLSILARSFSGEVTDDGASVWDQPAEVPRLSDDELSELHTGKPDLHGAGRHNPRPGAEHGKRLIEQTGGITGHPGRYANPKGPR